MGIVILVCVKSGCLLVLSYSEHSVLTEAGFSSNVGALFVQTWLTISRFREEKALLYNFVSASVVKPLACGQTICEHS